MFERRSALMARDVPAAVGEPTPLRIGEVRGFALVQAAAFAHTVEALQGAVRSVLEVDLPKSVGTPTRGGGYCVFRVGPEQFWFVGPEDARVSSLSEAVLPAIGSITSLSHGRTRLFIEGPPAREVLSKGIALDLHPEVFRADACALTELQHTPILLHRTGQDRYELYVLRTYAAWIWEWLTDAALPLGYEVAGP
jgi:sarcosine oxidase subunit gamma